MQAGTPKKRPWTTRRKGTPAKRQSVQAQAAAAAAAAAAPAAAAAAAEAALVPRSRVARLNIRTGGLLGVDLKCVDQILAATAVTATWTGGEIDPVGGVNCIGACVQGNGLAQRDGVRIVVTSIQIQGFVTRGFVSDQADMRGANLVQIALVMDTQSNAAQLNAEDVYVATDPEVPARRVIEYTSRFRVLKTWLIEMADVAAANDNAVAGPNSTISNAGVMHAFSCYKKMNQEVTFVAGAGAGTIADFNRVSFHMIACCFAAAPGDQVSYNSRVRFLG